MRNQQFQFHPLLIIRTPYFPLKEKFDEDFIKNLLQKEVFLEALYLASPNVYYRCLKLLDEQINHSEESRKLLTTVAKYYNRMSSRCTPFGLFAGCSVAKWSEKETHIMFEEGKFSRSTRLDMHFLCVLSQSIIAQKDIRQHLLFFPNSSIYQIGDELRYTECYYVEGQRRYKITSINACSIMLDLLEYCRQGVSYTNLCRYLYKNEISNEAAQYYLEELISSQLIVSELEPQISGKNYFYQILDTLRNHAHKSERIQMIVGILESIDIQLKQLDYNKVNGRRGYLKTKSLLEQLNVRMDEQKLFQTDLIKHSQKCFVDQKIQQSLLKALWILRRIPSSTSNKHQIAFIKKYKERYGEKEMPLVEVLDAESGIGYPVKNPHYISELTEGLGFSKEDTFQQNMPDSYFQRLLINKLQYAHKHDTSEIELKQDELENIPLIETKLPPSLSILFRIVNHHQNTLFVESITGSSAVNLLGRFSLIDAQIDVIAQEIAKMEKAQNPNIIFAEIIHLPESRTGNVLLHQIFREYEIPYLAKSSQAIG